MGDPITLVRWGDAKTDPPQEQDGLYQTDTGFWHYHDGRWVGESSDGLLYPAKPRPSVWCDPTPPGDDALTLDDLRTSVGALLYAAGDGVVVKSRCRAVAVRLRRAIEEADR